MPNATRAPQEKPPETPQEIGVLLFDGFSNHCLANAVEPLRAANGFARKTLYRWTFLTIDGEQAVSSSGLPVMPAGRLGDHPGGDFLFLLPSYGFRAQTTPAMLRSLRAAAGRFRTLVGMDTGAWLMAAAGLLDGCRATIHWDELTALAEAFPDLDVTEDRFVIDGNRITCGGVTTTFDLILELIRQRHGAPLRLEVAALFMHGERSHPTDPALRMTGQQTVDAAVALMRRNIETPLTVARIGARLGLGQRRLETLFAQHLGAAPRTVYRRLRLHEARRLVERASMSVAEIATRCGYVDASAMTRAYRREFGVPPRAHRTGD